ncbi:MAG: GNAT family N-acetyltransferase [Promethearchaeota archaeon]
MSQIHIRALKETDANFLNHLDSQVKWGFSQKPPDIFLEFSNSAYLAEDSVLKVPYGIVVTYHYPPSTGWIGFLIVDEKYREKGIGRTLFSKAVDHLLEIGCKEILLDAVPDAVSLYESFRFSRIERSLRLKISLSNLLESTISSPQSFHMRKKHIKDIGKYDLSIFGAERKKIFVTMLKNPKSEGVIFFQDKIVKGYGFIRFSKSSFSIGPLLANSSDVAFDIISKLIQIGILHCKKCEWILIGITETSSIPLQFFYHLGFKEYNYSIRMRYGTNQRKKRKTNLIYSIAAPAMG